MAISGYRLPQQLQNNSSTNQQVNELLKTNLTRDNSNSVASANSDSATSTMLDMWAASKIEAASNSNSSSNLGGGAPPTPPITGVERSAIVGPSAGAGGGQTGSQTGQGGISASQASGSISTPGSIKGLNFTILFEIRRVDIIL